MEAPSPQTSHRSWIDEDLVPLSALQHYAYCPRQCALIHIEQVWEENIYTLRGRRAHEAVDRVGGASRDGVRTEYALPLYSDRLGLIGKADAVEFQPDGTPYPVEHKVGGRKARWADEVQLIAQALCLEEMFARPVLEGALFYRKTRRRRIVQITEAGRSAVEQIIEEVRHLLRRRRLPPPVADARCTACSLIETCMPYIVDRLQTPNEEEEL